MLKRSPLLVLVAAALALSAAPNPGAAANTAPAIDQFNAAFVGVTSYTYKLRSHEVKGTSVQDRLYDYSFLKPHFAKTLIESGNGKGSGGVWTGGNQVSGHQGGFLSGIHMKVDLHDGRAISLRGYTIPDGLLQNIVATFANVPGVLTQSAGGPINGVPTDRLDLKVADPASDNGVSEQVLYLSHATHFPVREILYSGSTIVVDQSMLDLNLNANLTQSDFPF